jgi:hypothetical protein
MTALSGSRFKIGMGLRRDLSEATLRGDFAIDVLEVAPENWMELGGKWGRVIEDAAERYPLVAHGLSLSLGSPDPIDWKLVRRIGEFLDRYEISLYSEHLSFCSCDNAHLYDLLPLPFRHDVVRHVAERIKAVQDTLGRRLYVENISYYVSPGPQMSEAEFLCAVLDKAQCGLLLDINNVYVNSRNHTYDPYEFLRSVPLEKVGAVHVAGHEEHADGSILDTHGDPVRAEVWNLLSRVLPALPDEAPLILERDFNCGDVAGIAAEIERMKCVVAESGDGTR